MALGSLKDLYLDELADLYAAETQMLRALPRLGDAAHAPELRDLLAKHCEESRLHLERLQLIFTHWGQRAPAVAACPGIAGIVQEADERLNQQTTDDVRDAAIIGAAQRIEHYEIAAYGCARTYARRLSRPDEARLLQETLKEEGRADHRLTELAEAHINDDARIEADFAGVPPTRLRYLERRQLDHSRLTTDSLRVTNDNGDALGTFDGLIITSAAEPRYIVVDARRLFTGRRYLLPVSEVRFDEEARVLRVNLSKEIADRYPEFDREDFEAMTPDALRDYDARLMEFFPRESAAGTRTPVQNAPPEWLMTGIWMTITPDRAAWLSEDARTFANEFAPDKVQSGGPEMQSHDPIEDFKPVDVAGPAQDVAGPGPDTREMPSRPERTTERRVVGGQEGGRELRSEAADETITPPHGDKLKSKTV